MSKYIVLVGIDYSEPSKIALTTAASIVRSVPESELHVAHVITPPPGAYPGEAGELTTLLYPNAGGEFSAWLAKARDDGRERLPKYCAEILKGPPERTTGHVRIGRPDRELVLLAGEIKANLMVLGTHGRTGLERVFLGSVAERVVRAAPCSVLVARPTETAEERLIEPPCPQCLETRKATKGAQTWCARHAEHHPRAHTYAEYPESFGVGALTFRF
jgi:nucleotide-binding universal stress UspA family protein